MKLINFVILTGFLILLTSCDTTKETTKVPSPQNTHNVNVPDIYYVFKDEIGKVIEKYNKGEFGEELFYLISFEGGNDYEEIAITVTVDTVQLTHYPPRKQSKTRQLTSNEFEQFFTFISENNIDILKDISEFRMYDGIHYQYLHCSKDKVSTFYINNPGKADGGYYTLVECFLDLANIERLP